MTINILIAFVLIYIGHQTRNLEIANLNLKHKIKEKNQSININQIEFSLYNDKDLKIKWITKRPIISKRDKFSNSFSEFKKKIITL